MRFIVIALLVATHVGTAGIFFAEAAEPTAQEQYLVYELNRARNNPAAWAQEFGLLDYTSPASPVPLDLSYVDPQPPPCG